MYQIGFGRADFSLSEPGLKIKQGKPTATKQELLLRGPGFRRGGPHIVWRSWSIYLAGSLLIVLYIATFLFWSVGFTFLARHYRDTT